MMITHRLGFSYAERENIIVNSDGNMDYYYDYVYAIEDGRWVTLDYGVYEVTYPEGSDGSAWEATYEWNGVEVSGEEYEAYLSEYTAGKTMIECGYSDDEYTLDELRDYLEAQ